MPGGVGAETEHDDQREVGDHLQQGPELRRHRDLLDLRVVEHRGLLVEPLVDVVLAAERLDRAQTQRRLLDVGGDVAGLVLRQPGQFGESAFEVQHDQRDRRDGDQHDNTQRPIHRQQDGGDDGDLQDVEHQEHQAERQQPTNRVEVVHDSRQQLAGLPLPVKGHRQDLQPGIEVLADVGLDTQGGPGHQPAPDEPQQRLGDTDGHRGRAHHPQPALIVVAHRTVDHRLGHQRDRDGGAQADDRDDDHGDPARPVGHQIRHQPPQVGNAARVRGRRGDGRIRAQCARFGGHLAQQTVSLVIDRYPCLAPTPRSTPRFR